MGRWAVSSECLPAMRTVLMLAESSVEQKAETMVLQQDSESVVSMGCCWVVEWARYKVE